MTEIEVVVEGGGVLPQRAIDAIVELLLLDVPPAGDGASLAINAAADRQPSEAEN